MVIGALEEHVALVHNHLVLLAPHHDTNQRVADILVLPCVWRAAMPSVCRRNMVVVGKQDVGS